MAKVHLTWSWLYKVYMWENNVVKKGHHVAECLFPRRVRRRRRPAIDCQVQPVAIGGCQGRKKHNATSDSLLCKKLHNNALKKFIHVTSHHKIHLLYFNST